MPVSGRFPGRTTLWMGIPVTILIAPINNPAIGDGVPTARMARTGTVA